MSVPILTRGDRGLHGYGPPMRCSYGSVIEVYESSSAEGPHVWLKVDASGWLTRERSHRNPGDFAVGTAHLNEEQARALIDSLQTWLDEIPARWGKR